jgi:hypothetical protein
MEELRPRFGGVFHSCVRPLLSCRVCGSAGLRVSGYFHPHPLHRDGWVCSLVSRELYA